MSLRFITATDDPTRLTLWAGYSSLVKTSLFGQVRDDKSLAFTIEPVISNPTGSATLLSADFLSTDLFSVAIGLADQSPTAGTFKLTIGGSTTNLTALAYNISAASLQTPMNVAMVAAGYAAGTVTDLGSGVYRYVGNSNGAVTTLAIVPDSTNLVPTCDVIINEVTLGSATAPYRYLIVVRQAPVALSLPTTLLAGTTVSVAVTQALSATADAVNTVSFTIDPVGGNFLVSASALGLSTVCGLAGGTLSAAEFQTVLENHPRLSGNVTVSKSGSSFIVDFNAACGPKTITGSTVANPTVITTGIAHGYTSGMTVTHASTNSTPNTDGARVVTVLSTTTYSVPVNVTVAGTTGTSRDSTAPLLSVTNIDLLAPQGLSGVLNLNTENLYEYSLTQTGETFDMFFSIVRTRASGEVRTIYGPAAITLSKDIVDPSTLVPVAGASYFTSTQSLNYFLNSGDALGITSLTSGTSTDLSSLVATDAMRGRTVAVNDATYGYGEWELINATTADNAALGYRRPGNYNASTNHNVWTRQT